MRKSQGSKEWVVTVEYYVMADSEQDAIELVEYDEWHEALALGARLI